VVLAVANTTIDLVLPDSGQLRAKCGEARVVSRPHIGAEHRQEVAGRDINKDRKKL
jgi:hypothetical protein